MNYHLANPIKSSQLMETLSQVFWEKKYHKPPPVLINRRGLFERAALWRRYLLL